MKRRNSFLLSSSSESEEKRETSKEEKKENKLSYFEDTKKVKKCSKETGREQLAKASIILDDAFIEDFQQSKIIEEKKSNIDESTVTNYSSLTIKIIPESIIENQIPPEIIEFIFSFIKSKKDFESIRLICKLFKQILDNSFRLKQVLRMYSDKLEDISVEQFKQLLQSFPLIEEIQFHLNNTTNEHLKIINSINNNNINSINLSHCNNITNKFIKHLPLFLTSLDISGIKLKSINLKLLPQTIKYLDLNNTNVIDEELEYLPKQIIQLKLMSCEKITNKGIEYLQYLNLLIQLDLTFCDKITEESIIYLPKSITHLRLDYLEWKKPKLQEYFPNLFYLSFYKCLIEDFKYFPNNLQILDLVFLQTITNKKIECLPSQLKHLDFSDTDITNEVLSFLPKSLICLNINYCNEITSFSTIPSSIQYLYIRYNKESIKTIPSSNIKYLEINKCNEMKDEEIKYIPQSLLGLRLHDAEQLTSKIFEYFHPNLRYLTLINSNIETKQNPYQPIPKETHFKDIHW